MVYVPSLIGEPLHRIIPKRKPYPLFSKQERNLVNRLIKEFWNLTGTELSDKSHKEFGWRLTKVGQTIHYRTTWLSSSPLTEDQIKIGQEIAAKHASGR
ncbi:MAG: hypothetical protein ABI988_20520 [Nitrospirota bacterium]